MRAIGICVLLLSAGVAAAQSGGVYRIEKSVIGSGGSSQNGATSVSATAGQPGAGGPMTGGVYSLHAGFWSAAPEGPSAAGVIVSGRVLRGDGRGLSTVVVTIADGSGNMRSTLTNTFGYFRFLDVESGQAYIVSVSSRRYTFANGTQLISPTDNMTDLSFTALR